MRDCGAAMESRDTTKATQSYYVYDIYCVDEKELHELSLYSARIGNTLTEGHTGVPKG